MRPFANGLDGRRASGNEMTTAWPTSATSYQKNKNMTPTEPRFNRLLYVTCVIALISNCTSLGQELPTAKPEDVGVSSANVLVTMSQVAWDDTATLAWFAHYEKIAAEAIEK